MYKKSLVSLISCALLAGFLPADAQKRGRLDLSKTRPERVEVTEAATTPARLTLDNPVFPLGTSRKTTPHDISVRPGAQEVKNEGRRKAPGFVLGDGTEIYGSLIYSNSWAQTTGSYGIYSFPASEYQLPKLVYNQGSYEANGGGCYHNGKYYWNSFVYTDEMGYTFTTFCTYDFNTKEFTKNILSFINDNFDLQQITNGLTYDPTSDRIFALGNIKVVDETGAIARYYPSFSEMDPYTGFVTPIAQIPQMIAIASDQGGRIYAISKGEKAALYNINKATGDCTLIGETGISADFAQSMAFDPVTGKLYWAAIQSNGKSALYVVNIETGEASPIMNFENNEEYTGLYIPAPAVEATAPAAVSDLSASFTNGALSGTITVKAPEADYSGTPLTGNIEISFVTDNGEPEKKTVSPGASVSFSRTLTEGIHSFTAFASNAAGDGPRIARSVYVGIDAPAAVSNLTLVSTDDGKAHISWDAPVTGRHEGYIDPSQLTYTVKRLPEGVTVAKNITSCYFTDPVDVPAGNFSYEVIPSCGGREGVAAETATALFGKGTGLPCRFSLDSKEEYDLFTVIDANEDWDGQYKWGGWMYGPEFKYASEEDGNCAVYGFHPDNAADDWLITPPVGVEKGKKYRLTFSLWTKGQPETIEVTAGPANTIAAQRVVIPKTDYKHTDHQQFTADFTAESDGNYFIGFHITSKKKQFYAFISDIMVDEVPDTDAPSAVTDLTATAAAGGENKATLSFTAPSTTVDGTPLSTIDKIEIFYGVESKPLETLAATPGKKLTWTDENVAGPAEYRIVPYANGKAGEKAVVSLFVGWDTPLAVTDASVTDASGHPVITWTAPTEGVNGGYIDPSKLTYTIYRYEDDLEIVKRNLSGTTYTDNELSAEPMQHLVAYVIVPQSPHGYGEPASTDYIVYGNPYKGEFTESFADVSVSSTPWVMYRLKGSVQNWSVTSSGSNPYCVPVDQDGGLAVYRAEGRVGDEGLLVTPKLDISTISSPVLSFYFYHNYTDEHEAWDEGFEDRMIPEVMLPDGSREALHDPIYVDDLGTGWLKYSCDLTKYKTQPYIRIALHGITAMEQDIYVDRLQITNLISNDLQAYAFTGPRNVEAGKDASYKFTVYNRGAESVGAGAYKVNFYDGSLKMETLNGVAIPSRDYHTFVLGHTYEVADGGTTHNIHAEIEWEADEIPGNNISTTISTSVSKPILPEVNSLAAELSDNNVSLSWSAPDSRKINESFEDQAAFDIENFGGYTMIDGDGNYTWSFQDIYFDNAGNPQSFMVFNPVALGIVDKASSLFPYDAFDPHTGEQVLACFQGITLGSDNYYVSSTNDDWFISPEVYGGQTISFYAKSGDYMQGLDKIQVMYSTGGTTAASFNALSEVITTGKDWVRYEYTLPASAKYFAIHCVSEDGFVLFIDDLEFLERRLPNVIKHTGYRLYRDGIMLQEFPTTTTSYVDPALADGRYAYVVKATYEDGRESAAGNRVEVQIGESAVEEIISGGPQVSTAKELIKVSGADTDSEVRVFTTDGKTIYTAKGSEHSIAVTPGIYLIELSGKARKIIVK